MGLIKFTGTAAGEPNTAIMALNQYGLRARFTPPRAKIIATTHRASSGTTRTLTLAEPHDMDVGDYFIPGNITASYNTTSNNRVFPVSNVPDPNQLSYVYSTTLNEAETEHTTGSIVRLGWKSLRIGMRYCLAATTNVSGPARAWGLGIGQGAFPVSSDSCVSWLGLGSGNLGSYNYMPGEYPYLSSATDRTQFVNKVGANWNTFAGSATAHTLSPSRDTPAMLFVEIFKSDVNNTLRIQYANWRNLVVTKARFLTILKHNAAFQFSGGLLYGLQGSIEQLSAGDYITLPHSRFLGEGGLDFYLEPYCRYANNDMEIMDIGYCLIP